MGTGINQLSAGIYRQEVVDLEKLSPASPAIRYGRTLWLRANRLLGSYWRLTAASRL